MPGGCHGSLILRDPDPSVLLFHLQHFMVPNSCSFSSHHAPIPAQGKDKNKVRISVKTPPGN